MSYKLVFLLAAITVIGLSCSDDDGKDLTLTAVEFRGDSADVVLGKTLTMSRILNITGPDSLMAEMEYSSSDESVASFETDGIVTGNALGGTTITAREKNTGLTDDVYLTVINEEVEEDDE